MKEFIVEAGFISFMLVVLYSAKQVCDTLRKRKESNVATEYEDYTIYKAARKFAQGAPEEEVKEILSLSYEFDPSRIEQTMQLAVLYRKDKADEYGSFIRAVNQVLGGHQYA